MNVTSGNSFFHTVPGSAARPEAVRPAHGMAQILQAQAVEEAKRTAPPARGDAPARAPGLPYGPRGSLIDIVA